MATVHEQTIWIAPRATAFTDVCAECEEEQGDGHPWATVRGSLPLGQKSGWARCPHGHSLRVRRLEARVPAGASR